MFRSEKILLYHIRRRKWVFVKLSKWLDLDKAKRAAYSAVRI